MKLVTKTTQFAEVVVTQHLQGRKPDPRCTRARGASVRPSTNTEPAGASGAPGAARCALRGRQRALLLFGTPLPKTCAMGDIGSHWVTTWLPMSAIAWFPRTPNHPWHWMNACTHTGPAAARPAARAAAPRTERAAPATVGAAVRRRRAILRLVLGAARGTGSVWCRRVGAHRVAGRDPGLFERRRSWGAGRHCAVRGKESRQASLIFFVIYSIPAGGASVREEPGGEGKADRARGGKVQAGYERTLCRCDRLRDSVWVSVARGLAPRART